MYIVVIRKKHYLEVITKELMEVAGSKSTYQYITDNPITIIQKHIKYMKNINFLAVSSNSIGCLNCIKLLLVQGLLLPQIGAHYLGIGSV